MPLAERATQAVYPSPLLSPLEAQVRKLLEGLVEKGQITGCQVTTVFQDWRSPLLFLLPKSAPHLSYFCPSETRVVVYFLFF